MLKTLTIVTGLPGSGKTTWCRAQKARHSFLRVVDDPMVDPSQWENIDELAQHALISGPHFCAMDEEVVVQWIAKCTPYWDTTTRVQWVVLENRLKESYQRCTHKAAGLSQRLHENFNVPPHAYFLKWNELTDWNDILENKHVVRRSSP